MDLSERAEIEEKFLNRIHFMYTKAGIKPQYDFKKNTHILNHSMIEDRDMFKMFVYYPDKKDFPRSMELIAEHRVALSSAGFSEFVQFRDNWFKFTMTYRQIIDGVFEQRTEVEAISDKIQKLLALSKSPNEHEAKLAAMKAQELIAEYGYEGKDDGIIICIAEYQFFKSSKYEAELIHRTCQSYRVKAVTSVNNKGKELMVELFGTKTDLHIYQSIINYLAISMWEKGRYMTSPNNYYIGFIVGVSEALSKQCVALAIVVPPEIDSKIKEHCQNLTSSASNINITDYDSFERGVQHGKEIMDSRKLGEE